MKPATETKLKFKQLKRRLKLAYWQIVGVLECLWRVAEANCPAGDIGRLSDDEIATAMEWDGDPGELISALVEYRWLDRDEEFRLIIHGWSEHCPNHLKGAFVKHNRLFADEVARQRADSTKHDARQVPSSSPDKQSGINPPSLSSPSHSIPSPSSPSRLEDSESAVAAVIERGANAGAARKAVEAAVGRRVTIKQVFTIIDYFDHNQHWGVGALVDRIDNATPRSEPSAGWPQQLTTNCQPSAKKTADDRYYRVQAFIIDYRRKHKNPSQAELDAALVAAGYDPREAFSAAPVPTR